MKILLIIAVLEILYVGQSIQESPELLNVTIYYESLCPFSVTFINEQLYPGYQKIGSSLRINFVPYGNAKQSKENGTWTFDCQHGEEECWGNKAQACGLAEDKAADEKMEYVNCMMAQDDPASKEAVNECAPKLGVTGDSILNCINERGDELLAKYGEETALVEDIIPGVPAMSFNDKYDIKLHAQAYKNFLQVCCKLLSNAPDNCPSEDNTLDED